uniref:Uncharacterized protein n=1 Tax=Anguilla anguilla TaxID=7936 RepID=A0A0E9SBR1_ANGAN
MQVAWLRASLLHCLCCCMLLRYSEVASF